MAPKPNPCLLFGKKFLNYYQANHQSKKSEISPSRKFKTDIHCAIVICSGKHGKKYLSPTFLPKKDFLVKHKSLRKCPFLVQRKTATENNTTPYMS